MKKANGLIAIDKGVPIPQLHKNSKYPWPEMKVGDSFVFPKDKHHCYEAARTANKRYAPMKFAVKTTDDGMRCWRVE